MAVPLHHKLKAKMPKDWSMSEPEKGSQPWAPLRNSSAQSHLWMAAETGSRGTLAAHTGIQSPETISRCWPAAKQWTAVVFRAAHSATILGDLLPLAAELSITVGFNPEPTPSVHTLQCHLAAVSRWDQACPRWGPNHRLPTATTVWETCSRICSTGKELFLGTGPLSLRGVHPLVPWVIRTSLLLLSQSKHEERSREQAVKTCSNPKLTFCSSSTTDSTEASSKSWEMHLLRTAPKASPRTGGSPHPVLQAAVSCSPWGQWQLGGLRDRHQASGSTSMSLFWHLVPRELRAWASP